MATSLAIYYKVHCDKNNAKFYKNNVQISIHIFSSSIEKQKRITMWRTKVIFFFQFTKIKRSGFQNWILWSHAGINQKVLAGSQNSAIEAASSELV